MELRELQGGRKAKDHGRKEVVGHHDEIIIVTQESLMLLWLPFFFSQSDKIFRFRSEEGGQSGKAESMEVSLSQHFGTGNKIVEAGDVSAELLGKKRANRWVKTLVLLMRRVSNC